MKTVPVFHPDLQRETPHEVSFAPNGEVVLTCTETGHFIKLDPNLTPEQIKNFLTAYKNANTGNPVTVEQMEKRKEEILAIFESPEGEQYNEPTNPQVPVQS